MASSPDGRYLYIASGNDSNTVLLVDTTTHTVTQQIAVASNPTAVAISPDGSRVYATNYNDNTVSVIDTSTNSVVTTIPVGTRPVSVAVSPDGSTVYVANEDDNTVSVIDAGTATVTQNIIVFAPSSLVLSPTGDQLYVVDSDMEGVVAIDTESNTIVDFYSVPRPSTVPVISPDGRCVYVGSRASNTAYAIDTQTNEIAEYEVTAVPDALALSRDGTVVGQIETCCRIDLFDLAQRVFDEVLVAHIDKDVGPSSTNVERTIHHVGIAFQPMPGHRRCVDVIGEHRVPVCEHAGERRRGAQRIAMSLHDDGAGEHVEQGIQMFEVRWCFQNPAAARILRLQDLQQRLQLSVRSVHILPAQPVRVRRNAQHRLGNLRQQRILLQQNIFLRAVRLDGVDGERLWVQVSQREFGHSGLRDTQRWLAGPFEVFREEVQDLPRPHRSHVGVGGDEPVQHGRTAALQSGDHDRRFDRQIGDLWMIMEELADAQTRRQDACIRARMTSAPKVLRFASSMMEPHSTSSASSVCRSAAHGRPVARTAPRRSRSALRSGAIPRCDNVAPTRLVSATARLRYGTNPFSALVIPDPRVRRIAPPGYVAVDGPAPEFTGMTLRHSHARWSRSSWAVPGRGERRRSGPSRLADTARCAC